MKAPPFAFPGEDALRSRWRQLSPRGRLRVLVISALALGLLGYQAFYHPQVLRLRRAKSGYAALSQQVDAMRKALPDLEQERIRMEKEEKGLEALRQEIQTLENQLLAVGELGGLLGVLAQQAEGLQINFESIKQQMDEDPDQPAVDIEVTFRSSYEDLVNYLRRVERLSHFLQVSRLELTESKEEPKSAGKIRLTLTTPLRLTAEGAGVLGSVPPLPSKVALPRNPLALKFQPVGEHRLEAFKVTGIIFRGTASTAIVNDRVVRIGDKIDHLIVKQILPEMVILSDGVKTYSVALES